MPGKTLTILGLILLTTLSASAQENASELRYRPEEAFEFQPLKPWSSDPEMNRYPGYGYFRVQRVYASRPPGKIWLNTQTPLLEKVPSDPRLQQKRSTTYNRFWPAFGRVAGTLASTFLQTTAGTNWLR